MSKKQLVIILVLSLLFFTTASHATPAKIDWDKLAVEKDIKPYENKQYKTIAEYKEAYYQKKCSSVWLWMHLDKQAKIEMIAGLKSVFREKGNVTIKKPTEFYVNAIDDVIINDPRAINYKIGVIFKTIAVIEYDFNEGIDKDITAKKWLRDYYEVVKESIPGKSGE